MLTPCTFLFYILQFEGGILDACLRILDMNPKCLRNPGKDHSGRRNPVYISRALSAMVTFIPHMCCQVLFVHFFFIRRIDHCP